MGTFRTVTAAAAEHDRVIEARLGSSLSQCRNAYELSALRLDALPLGGGLDVMSCTLSSQRVQAQGAQHPTAYGN